MIQTPSINSLLCFRQTCYTCILSTNHAAATSLCLTIALDGLLLQTRSFVCPIACSFHSRRLRCPISWLSDPSSVCQPSLSHPHYQFFSPAPSSTSTHNHAPTQGRRRARLTNNAPRRHQFISCCSATFASHFTRVLRKGSPTGLRHVHFPGPRGSSGVQMVPPAPRPPTHRLSHVPLYTHIQEDAHNQRDDGFIWNTTKCPLHHHRSLRPLSVPCFPNPRHCSVKLPSMNFSVNLSPRIRHPCSRVHKGVCV